VRGHASVFSSFSLDLGGFRERVLPGAFDRALSMAPKVLLLWDHDTRRVLASTQNGSLRLETNDFGLRFDAYVLRFSYAADFSMAMEAGLINEASFAFTVERGDWSVAPTTSRCGA
jgi:HK97 family phage prohead protease